MPIIVTCSGCSSRMNAPDNTSGKRVKCPKCGMVFTVPDSEQPAAAGGVTERPEPPVAAVSRSRRDDFDDEPASRASGQRGDLYKDDDDRPRRSSRRRGDEEDEDEDVGPRPVRRDRTNGPALGLGIASLVCSIIALPVALFPCTSIFSLVLSGLALVLGLIGFILAAVKQWDGVAFPIAGTAVSVLAIAITALWMFVCAGLITSGNKAAQQTAQALQQAQQQAEQAQKANEERERTTLLAQGWIDAGNNGTFKLANVAEVRIVSVKLAPVAFEQADAAPWARNNKYIQIVVSVRNLAIRDLEYKSWSQARLGDAPRLSDNMLRAINAPNFGGGKPVVVGQQRNTNLQANQQLTDLLVFDKPFLNPTYLRLELPGSAIGAPPQTVRFFIPGSMVPR
jgi:hypothetical protein